LFGALAQAVDLLLDHRDPLVALGERSGVVAFHDPRLAPDLDPPPVRIVDQEQMRLRIVREIALRLAQIEL
jgi:hypothetical protein